MWPVTITKPLLELMWARRMFHDFHTERWRVGQRLLVASDCEIEPYSHILTGEVVPRALGAFSYCRSEFEVGIRVGRYSSLASGIKWMGSDHPTDWASTSPVFFDHSWLGSPPSARSTASPARPCPSRCAAA
jgi:hypothetical protein